MTSSQTISPPSLRDSAPRSIAEILRNHNVAGTGPGALLAEGRPFDASAFISEEILEMLPSPVIRRLRVLPFAAENGHLAVLTSRTVDHDAIDEIEMRSGMKPVLCVTYPADLDQAINACEKRSNQLRAQSMKLGEILVERRVISDKQLAAALDEQKRTRAKLGEILVQRFRVPEATVYSALAAKLDIEYRAFEGRDIDKSLAGIVPQRFAESHNLVPLSRATGATKKITVAMANPQDLVVIDMLRKTCEQQSHGLEIVLASPNSILRGISCLYDSYNDHFDKIDMETVQDEVQRAGRSDLVNSELPDIKRLVNQMLYQAVMEGASDVHIENLEGRVRVRYRIDGILQTRDTGINKKNIDQVISVLKIDANLDFAEHRRPQDGSFKSRIGSNWFIDFRINVHSTEFGSDAVIRVLDSSKRLPELDNLGFRSDELARFKSLIKNPHGLVLITGPTGSGKSTTLYSTLGYLNSTELKIVTAEDPVEYHLDGVSQYQVNEGIGNTFAEYARRFLRKDPDIILIGETRDEITAASCVRASATGHLVFSTLHTNTSTAAIRRLRDLGINSSSICDCLVAVISQRLVRTICQHCAEEYEPSSQLLRMFYDNRPDHPFYRGTGCPSCHDTGYTGRIGIWEQWEIDAATREAIMGDASELSLRGLAIDFGMRPMAADALDKVRQGKTNLEELRRVLSEDQIIENRWVASHPRKFTVVDSQNDGPVADKADYQPPELHRSLRR